MDQHLQTNPQDKEKDQNLKEVKDKDQNIDDTQVKKNHKKNRDDDKKKTMKEYVEVDANDGVGYNLFGRDELVLSVGENDLTGSDVPSFHSGVDHPEIS